MSKSVSRSFGLDFKLSALARMAGGERISALSAEFGVHRQLLYKWREAHRAGRLGGRPGRPTMAQALARTGSGGQSGELEAARRRVAELERKVGQQAVELDFFQGALRRIKASRPVSE